LATSNTKGLATKDTTATTESATKNTRATKRASGRPLVVIVSADAEWVPVRDALRPVRVERSPYGECFTHTVAGERVRFVQGGWGKISAAASADHAITTWRPEVLINLGTCGGIEGRVQRGETLLVTRTIAHDVRDSIGDPGEAIRAYSTDIDVSWLGEAFPLESRRAPLVSGDRDLVPADVPDLVRRFDAVAADWESGAIAWVASRRHTRLLIVRGVSDLVGERSGEAAGNRPLFERRATAVMLSLLDGLSEIVPCVRRALERSAEHGRRERSSPPS
jgi:adenosylhomocysteine nucleosidase